MNKVLLGATGLRITPLVYGTLPLGPLQAGLSPAEGGRLIRHALECGVTMLDTAELYGTYAHVRAGLEGYSGEVVVASKTHAPSAALARQHVEGALRQLGRERLEIVHLHAARISDPFTERAEVLTELLRMKEEGKIGHVGMSSHYICAVRRAVEHPEIEVIHPLLNRTGMGILDGSAAQMAEAVAACAAAGKGVYTMKALAGGNLIGSARESLRFVLALPGVQGVAIGMLSEAEIEANLELLAEGRAEDRVWERLEQGRRRLKIMANFCKGCGACVEACTAEALRVAEGRAEVDDSACILCGYCAAACPEFIIRVV
jgi:aryl-alcohol dehydrogenase-like predicted oxidoreductase/NAD-dependent dihydropyrimidine dehydrogenase PreA subunit